ncbi:MAG: hypothetical protein KAS74_00815 [Methanosarcinales archaeon]|nr:hypothetical protein [Methanosarcinales archaeon]
MKTIDPEKRKQSTSVKTALKAMGLFGFLLFSGILGFIYFYLKGDVELNQISWTHILFLIAVTLFWAVPPVRDKLCRLSVADNAYNRFGYSHPILAIALAALVGLLIGALLILLGIWEK